MASADAQSNERIFISYSRKDGEDFAHNLRKRLIDEHNLSVWQDRKDMEGGTDWWLQIEAAIKCVEYLIIVMSPAAIESIESDVIRKEWRLARQEGVCVLPVLTLLGLNFAKLPHWMRATHFVDTTIPEQWDRFILTLKGHCKEQHVPLMIGDLKEYVPRPAEVEAVISKLLDEKREQPVAITIALKGAGGYGKTTIARAICHDEQIRQAFDDGILWVTLGENPGDLTGRVIDLIEVLSSERPGYSNIEAATARFQEILAERDILMAIDDVWDNTHLRPFTQGGTRCARIIATRDKATLPAGTQKINVDAMRESEALDLLRREIVVNGQSPALLDMADRLGRWPLPLKLVNAALIERVNEYGQSLADAIAYVESALQEEGLEVFDADNATERSQAVRSTLNTSLNILNEGERVRYGELAVFPEDIDIPFAALEKLWGRSVINTEKLCNRLFQLSLLLDFAPLKRTIRIHDVVVAYLIQRAADSLAVMHSKLLAA